MDEPLHNRSAAGDGETSELEDLVVEVLGLPEDEQPAAFEALRLRHPDAAELLRRWEFAAGAIRTNADAEVMAGAVAAGSPHAVPPDLIDGYEIDSVLGEGGMGTVYLATQLEPVRRQVALKVVKRGMDTAQILRRFELERQTLARMNHDAIAKVYDAGQTSRGQPFFAMEFVPGVPVTRHCDQHRLTLRERIELFRQVCRGVQHAHQKGVIHRDLKPGNLLVVRDGDRSTPKIIDFGLVRALDSERVVVTHHGGPGQFVGTPEYMAPEQAGLERDQVDTRTDVYSLGVMLYEILTGELPFSSAELRHGGHADLSRKLRDTQPSRPSTRIVTRSDASLQAAARRRTSIQALNRQLRGDLDWIVLKAMAKEPERRYDSASDLAQDLGRYLAHEPVEAGPPGTWYRVRKLVRRNRLQFAAAGVVFVALVGGVIGTMIGMFEAWAQKALVQTEATTATRVAEFMVDMFEVSNPSEARGNSITAREILDRGAAMIDELEDQPKVQARLQQTMGDVYRNLGLYQQAEPLLVSALAIRRRELGHDDVDTLRSLDALGKLAWDLEDNARARTYHEEALSRRRRTLGDDDPETLASMNNYGLALRDLGELEEAAQWLRRALEGRRRVLGGDDEKTLISVANMAQMQMALGNNDDAGSYYREVLATRRRVLAEDHPDILTSINDMGVYLQAGRDYVGAEKHYREALEGSRRVRGDDHRETLNTLHNLGSVLVAQGRLDDAEPYIAETLSGRRQLFGDDAEVTLRTIRSMSILRTRQRQFTAAEALFLEIAATRRRTLGADDAKTIEAVSDLASFFNFTKQPAKSEPIVAELLEFHLRSKGEDADETILSRANLAIVWALLKRHGEAEPVLRQSIAQLRERDQAPTQIALYQRFQGQCLYQLQRYAEAETTWLESHRIYVAEKGDGDPSATMVAGSLVALYEAWGKSDAAAAWRARLPVQRAPAKQPPK